MSCNWGCWHLTIWLKLCLPGFSLKKVSFSFYKYIFWGRYFSCFSINFYPLILASTDCLCIFTFYRVHLSGTGIVSRVLHSAWGTKVTIWASFSWDQKKVDIWVWTIMEKWCVRVGCNLEIQIKSTGETKSAAGMHCKDEAVTITEK